MNKISTLVVGVWLICISCGDMDLLDFDKVSDKINWKPDLVAPVGYGSFTMWELLEQSVDSTIVNIDNQLMIRYAEKDIYHMDAEEFFDLPDQDIEESVSIPVSIPNLPTGIEIPLPEDVHLSDAGVLRIEPGEGYELNELITSLALNYSFPQMGFKYSVQLTLLNVKTNAGSPLTINIDHPTNNQERYYDLVFDMHEAPNQISYQIDITIPQGEHLILTSSLSINLAFGFTEFNFKKLTGKLKPTEIEIPADQFKIDVDFLNELSGKFLFSAPRLDLVVRNSGVGVPIKVDIDFTGYGDGKTLAFVGDPLQFLGNATNAEKTEILGYNADNSNIAELLSLPPTEKITYGGTVTVNPAGGTAVLYHNAKVSVDAEIEIPLKLTADSLIYTNTIKDIDISDAEKIVRAGVTLKVLNGIPLEVYLEKLVLTDYYNETLDVVLVKSGKLDAAEDKNGIITPKSSVLEVELTEENISHLNNTKNIQLVLRASTGNSGRPVSLTADAKLEATVILRAKIDANLE